VECYIRRVTFVDVFVAIAALCVVIMIHEFGHYILAVWSGMKVDRFSVFGIGPAILKLGTWRGTEFVIGAVPIGAYVLIRGMEPEDEEARQRIGKTVDPPPSENFRDKPLWARSAVIAGGPVANYITAILLFLLVFAVAGMRGPVASIQLHAFAADSAAQAAGLEIGDELVAIGDHPIDPTRRGMDVAAATEAHRGAMTTVTVRRGGELVTRTLTVPVEGSPLGIEMRPQAGPRVQVGFGEATAHAISEPFLQTKRQLAGLWMLISGQLDASLSGPPEIVHQIARSAAQGWVPLIEMTALISTLLGMFNLLPLPALDGGRLAFLGYEAVVRRRASPRVEELVHGYGMLALLVLVVVVSVGDIRRFIG
jgi:regulator of sigma E protease